MALLTRHLAELEAEAIFIIRETVAEVSKPVMLYSIGKDSSVLLHLALKAFAPSPLPFPLLHVDTTWKFREMIAFRAEVARDPRVNLMVVTNEDGLARGLTPFGGDSALYTQVMKTQALRDALDRHGFNAAIGGARRDEEKSRAKERIFSLRSRGHSWEPRAQRPELWRLYNTQIGPGESFRIFPLSNWTEIDVWDYIAAEDIRIVPLYLAKERPVVRRGGTWIMRDDERLSLTAGEHVEHRTIRFRTLGCYPLTGAIESQARTVQDIRIEMRQLKSSERHGRLIDAEAGSSMEQKKREGYF